jgi:hypothetical protein
VTRESDL